MQMQRYKYPDRSQWNEFTGRPEINQEGLEKSVRKILEKVKTKGDKAVHKYNREFVSNSSKKFLVNEKEINKAEGLLPIKLKEAIHLAARNIEKFHEAQKAGTHEIETMPGVKCWRRSVAIDSVGLYIPGGSAPLFSTVLMLAIPARMAGCREIILCTPPSKENQVHPAILYSAKLCGITQIFKIGGAQAIGAMAFGSETVPKVRKIFGPGNQYVTMAKRLVQLEGTGIDMLAGPSELLVIADETAVPSYVAADLLSQAEHGPDSQVLLVTTSEELANRVEIELSGQIEELPRKKIAVESLRNSKAIIVRSLDEALEFSNLYAPEHLILACDNFETLAEKIESAGSVFLGNFSPESAGDYASGTNHVLPTNGFATLGAGVSLDSFVKKITYQRLTEEGINNIGNAIMEMANAEGLEGHRNAVAIRLKNLK